jgi:signal transduction histidine kinase
MRWHSSILILLMLAINPIKASAQYIPPDSLKKLINSIKADSIRIDAMNWLSFRYYQNLASDSSQFWADKALNLSTKINYKSGIGFAYINTGNIKMLEPGKLLTAAADFQKAVKVLEEAGDKGFMGITYSNLALIDDVYEKHSEGLRNLYKALRLQSESGFEFGLAHCYLVWGMHYLSTGENREAFKNLQSATTLFQKLGENHLLSNSYLYKGDANLGLGNYQLALADYNAGKEVYKELGDPFWLKAKYFWCIAGVLENQGDSCYRAKNPKLANEIYNKAEKNYFIAIQHALKQDVVSLQAIYNCLGILYQKEKKNLLAKKYFNKSISIYDFARSKAVLSSSYYSLSVLDSAEGNLAAAYYNYKKHILYRDSLFNEENTRKSERYKIEFEFEKKEDEIKLLTTENNLKTTVASKQEQQKNFALAGISIIVLAGGYAFIRYRKKRKLQSEQAISNERLRISQELHDEVGATLSGISMYSHLTKEQIRHAQTAEVEKSLNIMQQSAGEMVNKLNDIVWLINPGQDTLQKLIQRLEEYAAEMTAIKNIKLRTTVPEQFLAQSLPVESRRNIYLFCKEAINNAVKYSEADLLELIVKENNNQLQIAITDNGKGFTADVIKRGNGLNNMQKRADELGADFNIQSKPGEGAVISLKVKITQ